MGAAQLPPDPQQRNPLTHQRHRSEVLWQVLLPLWIGVLLVLGSALVVAIGGANRSLDTSKLAATSTIWLVAPMLLISLIFLALLVSIIYLLTLLLSKTPPFARRVQDFFTLLQFQVRRYADRAVEPVLRLEAFFASLGALRRKR